VSMIYVGNNLRLEA